MNRTIKVLSLFTFLFISSVLVAQTSKYDFNASVPLNPDVRYGTLKNGMKYYIQKNETPKERADFYIIHNVGAMLEEPDQNGLAHFVEHMAFNGLEHFPGKNMLNYMEKNGIVFGKDINAFTSYDVTAYNLSRLPVRPGMIDTALLVLHDWSNSISMEHSEIDAERGVIREEWRTRRNANFRLGKLTDKATYNGSKYAEHDVIGSLSVIDTFHYETIKNFYHDWYRTNLQAVIIVGDFDPVIMEQKVINLFSSIPESENKKERYYIDIPDNDKPLIAVATDPEAEGIAIKVMFKQNAVQNKKKNFGYLRDQYILSLYSEMFNNRFSEISQQENAPFNYAYNYFYDFTPTKAANNFVASSGNTGASKALQTLLLESKKVQLYGFTKTELERAKTKLISDSENAYQERNNTKSESFVWKYFSNFTSNEPALSIENEHQFVLDIVPEITLEQVNSMAKQLVSDKNMVVTITGPQKDEVKLPTEKEILKIIKDVSKAKVKAYTDSDSDQPLISKIPAGTKLVSEKTADGITEWKFANGVTVIIKSTDFKQNEILMRAYSPGGRSLIATEDLASCDIATSIITSSGISDFSQIDLDKKLTGKNIRVSPYIDKYEEGFSGSSTTKDFETFLQMTYLYFTSPRFDQQAYNSIIQRYTNSLENQGADPSSRFMDSVSINLLNNNPRRQPFNTKFLKQADINKVYEIYKGRFSDATGFVFIFVGNIDPELSKAAIGSYIGGLPAFGEIEEYKDNNIRFKNDNTKKIIKLPVKEEKSSVFIAFTGDIDYSAENILYFSAMNYILDLRYTATIREEEGGSYGVGVNNSVSKTPIQSYMMYAMFDCAPAKSEDLAKIIYREIELLQKNGPSQTDLDKTLEYLKKDYEEKVKLNNFWLGALYNKYANGYDITQPENYNDIVSKMTIESIRKAFNKIDTQKCIQLIMQPE